MNLTPRLRAIGIALAAILLTCPLPAQKDAKSVSRFTGVDLWVQGEADTFRPVDSLTKREIILAEPGLPSLRLRDAGPFVGEAKTKLSRATITVADFEQHRVTSVRNDRSLQSMSAQTRMADLQQRGTDWATAEVGQTSLRQSAANLNLIYHGPNPLAQRQVDRYNADAVEHHRQLGETAFYAEQTMADETYQRNALDAAQADDHDILELSFTLASPDPIAEAYVVVQSTVFEGEARGLATFHHLVGAVGPKPRKVRIRQTGFQPGFRIADLRLHLFAHGKELATSLSADAGTLSRDEARQFLLTSHLAEHARESLAATPVWNLAPVELFAAKSTKRYNHPVVATIDTDGSVLSLHDSEADARAFLATIHDASELRSKATPAQGATTPAAAVAMNQTRRAPDHIVAILREMFFLPALDRGTPVAGTVQINLADFFR